MATDKKEVIKTALSTKPKWEVADIFREHSREYLAQHLLANQHKKVIWNIQACRTAELGGHLEQCDSCDVQRPSYNSCCNRHCPKCQTLAKEKWLADRKAELLPVRYFHNVFTLPHDINPLALWNKKIIYGLLFKSVFETLLQFGKDPKHLGGKLGGLGILHTWDQKLLYHIHLHVVVPAGALSFDKQRWLPSKTPKYLFPVKALSKVFRGKFMDSLNKAHLKGELIYPYEAKGFKSKEGFNSLTKKLWEKDWVVYSKKPFGGPEKVMDYLGRYTHKVAISNYRILSLDKGHVSFNYRDRRDGDKEKVLTIKAEEFIRRFLLHIMPSKFMRIRHFGILANRYKKENIKECRKILGEPELLERDDIVREDPLEFLESTVGIDMRKCPYCQKGKMVIIKEIIGRNSHWKPIKPRPKSRGST